MQVLVGIRDERLDKVTKLCMVAHVENEKQKTREKVEQSHQILHGCVCGN